MTARSRVTHVYRNDDDSLTILGVAEDGEPTTELRPPGSNFSVKVCLACKTQFDDDGSCPNCKG